ncbi:MAG: MAPEG family protein [Sphingobium sp.]|nr:MAPEG family protein [Sphingobium sp.]
MPMPILAPAAILVLWSVLMLLWMLATRIPALAKLNIPAEQSRGGRGSDLDNILPRELQWKAHNYNHLMEQPTIFYAVVLILAVIGQGTGLNVTLAWAYVILRILHSLWQALVNSIPVRLGLFALSTIALGALAISAVRATLAI